MLWNSSLNMLKLKLEKADDSTNINRISALGNELVGHMKEIVWALSPGNDRLDSLLLFIRQYFVQLFEPLDYNINIIFPADIPEMDLDSEVRRNIFLCVKEALNNIIKHAHATQAELRLEIKNNKLSILIKDNGRGMPQTAAIAQTTGNGLKNICRRMNEIKGRSVFFNDNGTIVLLEINLLAVPQRVGTL